MGTRDEQGNFFDNQENVTPHPEIPLKKRPPAFIWLTMYLLSFVISGIFCSTFGFIMVGYLKLIKDKEKRKLHSQYVVYRIFRTIRKVLCFFHVIDYHIDNEEILSQVQGTVIIANHPSFLDVVLLLGCMPKVDCIIKSSLWKNKVWGFGARNSDYIINDDPIRMEEEMAKRLAQGTNILIFPEGTRTDMTTNELHPFKRGFLRAGLRSQASILPISIKTNTGLLTKGWKWCKIPEYLPCFEHRVDTENYIDIQKYVDKNSTFIMNSKRLTKQWQEYYKKRLSQSGRDRREE